jgi:pimeloyl-ACP methyl ester carboxylesterase
MATLVLVHGAWGGAHGFRHVRKLLRAEGHEVSTPSLTGIGERVHLASPLVNLGTHVRDVVHHVLYEDLDEIALVGFSYGGFVVTGALEHIAERVKHLVFLDAFVPKNGESLTSHVRGGERERIELGKDWLVTGPVREFDSPAEAEWIGARRTAHPRGCFTEPVYLARPLESFSFTRTYIKATRSPDADPGNDAFWRAARHAKSSPAWRYFEIDTNHMLASNRPEETAKLLAQIAGAT